MGRGEPNGFEGFGPPTNWWCKIKAEEGGGRQGTKIPGSSPCWARAPLAVELRRRRPQGGARLAAQGTQCRDWALYGTMCLTDDAGPLTRSAHAGEVSELKRQLAVLQAAARRDADALCALEVERHRWHTNQSDTSRLQEEVDALQKRFDTCLEVLGARNELIEEMEMDTREMKTAYKEQISLLAAQVEELQSGREAK
ncbi:hypothetical protein CYMTET_30562 [Cymbomonas tetramitiformis]|uniref:TATA element modulatory factor 1 TATA binding domain-containing protein n=1 Tax=Cymbomonas tetramitiformis TaxID=36881 RepID=A0AAE0KU28_9CHLO|nr:hypothetical protein CYMTET_30562 [Cymbomonas tetramitiformis]